MKHYERLLTPARTQQFIKYDCWSGVAGVIAVQRSGEPGNDDADFWISWSESSYIGKFLSPLVFSG